MMNPTHPGESVLNCIEESGWTVDKCAKLMGVPSELLTSLIHGESGISSQVATGLESIGWSNSEFWMRLQANYDLAQERRRKAYAASTSETGRRLVSSEID